MPMSQPATRTGLRPTRSVRAPVARLVSALVAPKATMNVVRGGERGEPERAVGQQGQHGAFLADHAADEGVDAHQEAELGEVLPQPQPGCGPGRHRLGGGHDARCAPAARAQSSGPPTSTETSSRPEAARMLARGHRPLPVTAHHGDRAGGHGVEMCSERAELEVDGAGYVTGGVLGGLADVEYPLAVHRRRRDEGDHADRLAFGGPGVEPAGQLAGEALVADGEALADEVGRGPGPRQRRTRSFGPGRRANPASDANCGRSGIDSEPGMWPAAKRSTGRTSTRTAPPAASRWAVATTRRARVGNSP